MTFPLWLLLQQTCKVCSQLNGFCYYCPGKKQTADGSVGNSSGYLQVGLCFTMDKDALGGGCCYMSSSILPLHRPPTKSHLSCSKHYSNSEAVYCQGFTFSFHEVDLKEARCGHLTLAFSKCFCSNRETSLKASFWRLE